MKIFEAQPDDDNRTIDWSQMDWNKPSLAVVASDGDDSGCILSYAGPALDFERCEGGGLGWDHLCRMGLSGAPEGISIWEGSMVPETIETPYGTDHDAYFEGEFRKPTKEEWESIVAGECPWDVEDWIEKKKRTKSAVPKDGTLFWSEM